MIHSGSRKRKVEAQLSEIHRHLNETANNVPFMTIFTLGEYGSTSQNANSCGELMLSFTGFSKE